MNNPPTIPRIADEPNASHTALCGYAALGPGRSLEKLVESWARIGHDPDAPRPPTRRIATLKEWSSRWGWQERVSAYDAEIAALRLAEEQRRWDARSEWLREESFKAAELGIKRVNELLARPWVDVETTESHEPDEHGRRVRVVTIRETPRASLRDIAALLKAVHDVGRLALGQPTGHTVLDLKIPTAEELAAMPTEQLDVLEQQIAASLTKGA
jgi:hypothetical protein